MQYKASAPGTLMLMGEYAVLHDGHALVAALNKCVTIALIPRRDQKIFITSALGKYSSELSSVRVEAPFQFVLTAIKKFLQGISSGFELEIDSELLHTVGLGSSAAVTTAVIAVLSAWLNLEMTQPQLISAAREVIQSAQGLGSGADVAGSVMGGVVHYHQKTLFAETLVKSIPLTVVYSGYKTPTVEAINRVKKAFEHDPKRFQMICHEINECVLAGITHIKNNDLKALGSVMNQQQVFMNQLGVNTPELQKIIDVLCQQPTIYGAKISGSGLGDCAIGLGIVDEVLHFNDPKIQVLSACPPTV